MGMKEERADWMGQGGRLHVRGGQRGESRVMPRFLAGPLSSWSDITRDGSVGGMKISWGKIMCSISDLMSLRC